MSLGRPQDVNLIIIHKIKVLSREIFLNFLMPSVDQTLRSQNKLKILYVVFWSFDGPGPLDQNRIIRGHSRDVVCRLGKTIIHFGLVVFLS